MKKLKVLMLLCVVIALPVFAGKGDKKNNGGKKPSSSDYSTLAKFAANNSLYNAWKTNNAVKESSNWDYSKYQSKYKQSCRDRNRRGNSRSTSGCIIS